MKRFFKTLISAIAGFAGFAFCGYWLIFLFSSNAHDRSMEAIMTSMFVIGPVGAIVCAIIGFKFSKRAVS
jgi:hypothetical protein